MLAILVATRLMAAYVKIDLFRSDARRLLGTTQGKPKKLSNTTMHFDFNYILLPVTLICFVAWLIYQRRQKLARQTEASADIPAKVNKKGFVYFCADIFPILLLVFVLRSFVVEPYQIPSGSMLPSLQIGDFILVNKFAYGVRLPISNSRLIPVGEPQRGDILVFEFPQDRQTRYIKRVVGVPGDRINLSAAGVQVNGKPHALTQLNADSGSSQLSVFREDNGEHSYTIARDRLRALFSNNAANEWLVPEGQYFVLGDNRDNSNDSRYWGFVPEDHVIGKAFFIWMQLKGLSELPSFSTFGFIDD